MGMMYYPSYEPPMHGSFLDGVWKVNAYDPANGVRWLPTYSEPKHAAIYHHSLLVSWLCDTEEEALRRCGEWSEKTVLMPDGRTVVPVEVFHPEYAVQSVFQPWYPGVREFWPGEEGWGAV